MMILKKLLLKKKKKTLWGTVHHLRLGPIPTHVVDITQVL